MLNTARAEHSPSLPSGPESRLVQAQGWCICITVVLATLPWSLSLLSFLDVKEAFLHVGLVVLAVLCVLRGMRLDGLRFLLPLWLWLGVALAPQFVFPTAEVPAYVLAEGARLLTLLLFAALAWDVLTREAWRRRLWWTLLASASAAGLLAILQYSGLLPGLLPAFSNFTQPAYSVFGNQDLLGGYMAMGLALAVAGPPADAKQISKRTMAVAAALAIPAAAGLVLSGSRSAWLAAAVGVGAALLLSTRHNRRLSVAIIAIAALTASVAVALTWPMPFERLIDGLRLSDAGGQLRLWFWHGAWLMWQDQPFFGVGLGQFSFWSPFYLGAALHESGGAHAANMLHAVHAHSEPLEYLAETGIIGAGFLLWMLVRAVRLTRRRAAWPPLIALLVFSGFNAAFHSAPHALAALLLLACAVAEEAPVGKGAFKRPVEIAAIALLLFTFHLYAVLLPSWLQRKAEDVHVAGEDPLQHYARVALMRWPQYEALEYYGLALAEQGAHGEAIAAYRKALHGRDTGRLHLWTARSYAAVGDIKQARLHLRAALYRWPRSEEVWQESYVLSPPEERAALEQHREHWELE